MDLLGCRECSCGTGKRSVSCNAPLTLAVAGWGQPDRPLRYRVVTLLPGALLCGTVESALFTSIYGECSAFGFRDFVGTARALAFGLGWRVSGVSVWSPEARWAIIVWYSGTLQ